MGDMLSVRDMYSMGDVLSARGAGQAGLRKAVESPSDPTGR